MCQLASVSVGQAWRGRDRLKIMVAYLRILEIEFTI